MDVHQQGEPLEVTVTVLSARNLCTKRKGEIVHASVVFGIGKHLFTTEVVESSNPEWNQEAVVDVSNYPTKSLKFKVRDKKNVLGVVRLKPVDLQSQSGTKWYHLQPYHTKARDVLGELQLDCWVSKTKTPSEGGEHGMGQRVKGLLHRSALTSSFRKKVKSANTLPDKSTSVGGDSSSTDRIDEITMVENNLDNSDDRIDRSDSNVSSVVTEDKLSHNQSDDSEGECLSKPEVSGVSPSECTLDGGQRVVMRGSNLGDSKGDIVRVLVADVDCTSSLEYFSSAKVAVTTPPVISPREGPVTIETVHGGTGTSTVHFVFKSGGSNILKVPSVDGLFGGKRKSKGNAVHASSTEELLAEIKALKQQVKELQDENMQLRNDYKSMKANRDTLLSDVIEQTPHLLEVKQLSLGTPECDGE
ncbi:hypothetical protein EMCRGX_G022545 [Ephydatia muelleri]